MRPLHEINPARLEWIDRLPPCPANTCSMSVAVPGYSPRRWPTRGADVTGVDMAGKALKVAQLHGLESGALVQYEESTAEAMARRAAAAFDVVTCMEMLRGTVPDPASTVEACAILARPGGWVFFSTLNRNPKSFVLAIVGAEYLLNLLPGARMSTRSSSGPAN